MPRIRQVAASDPELLLREAAAAFLTPRAATASDPFPSPPYLLVLRQGGLRDDLIRLAAAAGVRGWFDPPLCLLAELPARLSEADRPALGALERQLLLASLLRSTHDGVFDALHDPDAFVTALDAVIGELVAEGTAPEVLARVLADRDAAAAGDAPRDDFDRMRDAALLDLYRRYAREITASGRCDGRDAIVACARAVERDPAALARRLGGRREIRILGLADLRGGWRRLLAALAASPALDAVTLYGSRPLDLGGIAAAPESLDAGPSLAGRLFPEPGRAIARGMERPRIVSAPDTAREMEHTAVRVRALVEQGVPPHRIAVVSREARPHGELARSALERLGLPVSARRRIALRDVPVVRALMALVAAAAEGWTRHGLAQLAEQPYLGAGLDADVVNHVGYGRAVSGLAAWREALDALNAESLAHEARGDAGDDRRHRRPPPPSPRVRTTLRALAALAARASPLEGERPLSAWLAWLDDLVQRDAWGIVARIHRVPDQEFAIARADLDAWEQLRSLTGAWRAALAAWGGADPRLDAEHFHALLDGALAGDVSFAVGGIDGVQVLEALAAAHRGFDHVFLVGLESGIVPRRVPRSFLLAPDDRVALVAKGLPIDTPADWEQRERELFRVLVAAARRSITLSWSRTGAAGETTVRSPFIDAVAECSTPEEIGIASSAVLTPGLPVVRDAAVAAHAARAARIERARQTGVESRWNGLIEDEALRGALRARYGDDFLWSPTQLESYAKCPWAWFSQRLLHLEARADPDDGPDASVRGMVLHAALQRFYEDERAERGEPVLLRTGDRGPALERIAAALDGALADVGHDEWLGRAALRGALRGEMHRTLRAYVEFEIAENERYFNTRSPRFKAVRTGVDRSELELAIATLVRGGVSIRYGGRVDRMGRGVDGRFPSSRFIAAVDYKRTRGSTPGGGNGDAWDDGVVLQVPLYAHALEEANPADVLVRVEYRAIRTRERVHTLELYRVDTGTNPPTAEADPGERDKMERALDAAAGHVLRVRAGRFPARPAPSCCCPPFCPAWDICRTRGGPHTSRGAP